MQAITITEGEIRQHALARIAHVFGRDVESLRPEMSFADDFKASFVSDFRFNEYDHIDHDIRDVADKKITEEFANGTLTIVTVGDYCDHMVRCYPRKPEDVTIVLKLPGWEQLAGVKGALRSLWARITKAK